MAEFLDMSLDEIIKKNKKQGGYEKQQQRGVTSGVSKRRRVLVEETPSHHHHHHHRRSFNTPIMLPQVCIAEQEMVGWSKRDHGTTKLFVSNLDYGVSNDDIWLLFSDVGELKEYGLHFDRNGSSMGTAEVVFENHDDALAAVKRFHNMQLDGRPMKIEVVGVNVQAHPVPAMAYFAPRNSQDILQRESLLGSRPGVAAYGRDQNSRRGGHMVEPGHFTERSHRRRVSAKDLDTDLDKYRSGAVHRRVSAKDLDADLDKYRSSAVQIK